MAKSHKIGQITMIQRGTRWHCRFQINGKRISRSTHEENLAKAKSVAATIHTAAMLRSRGEEPCPTLAAAFDLWQKNHLLRKSPSHTENLARIGRLHLGSLKNIHLTDLTTALVEDELNTFLQKHSPSYANQWLTYIRIVCKWAIRRRMLKAVPFDVPELKIKQRPKPLIPTQKAKQWLDEVRWLTLKEPSIAMVLRLMIGLGLRSGEARKARWEWLDIERGTYTPGGTKGGKAWPRPVPPWILDELQPAKAHGWMTPSSKGKPITPGRLKRVFDAACKAVGLPKMVPHRLRATYATWLSEAGVPIHDIQAALEHKDIRTTAVYLGTDLGRVASAQLRIADKTGLR